MFVSFCTVTNNPQFIDDTYQSIIKQNLKQWEWVIILDGIPEIEQLRGLDNVHQLHRDDGEFEKNNLGSMKKKAFSRAQGDLLVDLDHDDVLEPGSIHHLVAEAEKNPSAFLYGDSAGFKPNGMSVQINSPDWKSYDRMIGNYNLRFHTPPEPSPYSLCSYLTVPHQPRAWTKMAYTSVGGFDEKCIVACEHDLICRTYAHGTPMIHVPEARSMYRIRGDAGGAMNIRRAEFATYAHMNLWKHLRPMVARWCRQHKLTTAVVSCRKNDNINIASYQWHDVFNVVAPTLDVALAALLEKEATLDKKFGAIMFSDFLQVIPAGEVAAKFKELTSGLIDDGWVLGDTPSSLGMGAGDPLGRSMWNEYTFKMIAPEVGLEIIYLNQYYPTTEHKTWNLSYIRSELCMRRK